MYILWKLTSLHLELLMMKDYNQFIQQKHMHMEKGKKEYVKKKTNQCNYVIK